MGCKLLSHLTFARRDWIKTKVSVHLLSPVRHVLCYCWYILLGVSIKRKDHFLNGIQRMRSEQWTLTEGKGKEKGLPVPQICWTSCTDTADSCISTGAFLTLQPSNRCTRCTNWCHGFLFRAGFRGGGTQISRHAKFRKDLRWLHAIHSVQWDTHPSSPPTSAQGSMCNKNTLYLQLHVSAFVNSHQRICTNVFST
jgi:hypothetical protein